ncbi:hypothetical protein L596_017267 [Steinernema carpocapsae]|uniref:Uncharacterized protein n=1 Tax=Steinernema carpocapsae TaxID=34508 RepID=A0A4U5N147_STECR|nr:hypothetical protein L596_017267 [Steinernema carpocapsae]
MHGFGVLSNQVKIDIVALLRHDGGRFRGFRPSRRRRRRIIQYSTVVDATLAFIVLEGCSRRKENKVKGFAIKRCGKWELLKMQFI